MLCRFWRRIEFTGVWPDGRYSASRSGSPARDAVVRAFFVKDRLQVQTMAIDVIRSGGGPVILELFLLYAAWVVRICPGHGRRSAGRVEPFEWVES